MVPLGIATAISYILLPVVDYSEKLKMPRTVGIIISILLSMVVILAVFVWIIPILANNISDISRALPELFNSVFNNIVYFVEKTHPMTGTMI